MNTKVQKESHTMKKELVINKEILKALRPCADRWQNYLEHYASFDGTIDEFLELENLTYDDKIWAVTRLLNRTQLVRFATLCAASVLYVYEDKYPDNKAPSELLAYLETIEDMDNMTTEENAELSRLISAAAYAANAAASAATYAASAANAATYSAATYAASAATYAAYATYAARKEQESRNLTFLSMAATL